MKMQPILLAAALAMACGTAAANSHGHGMAAGDMGCGMMGHGKMDHGKMDAAQRKAMAGTMFARLDANRDGAISRAEFDKHHEAMWAKMDAAAKPKAHDHIEQHK